MLFIFISSLFYFSMPQLSGHDNATTPWSLKDLALAKVLQLRNHSNHNDTVLFNNLPDTLKGDIDILVNLQDKKYSIKDILDAFYSHPTSHRGMVCLNYYLENRKKAEKTLSDVITQPHDPTFKNEIARAVEKYIKNIPYHKLYAAAYLAKSDVASSIKQNFYSQTDQNESNSLSLIPYDYVLQMMEIAIESNNRELIEQLVNDNILDIFQRAESLGSIYNCALNNDNPEVLKVVNIRRSMFHTRHLDQAIFHGSVAAYDYLQQIQKDQYANVTWHQANSPEYNPHNLSPLFLAIICQKYRMAESLLQKNINEQEPCIFKYDPHHYGPRSLFDCSALGTERDKPYKCPAIGSTILHYIFTKLPNWQPFLELLLKHNKNLLLQPDKSNLFTLFPEASKPDIEIPFCVQVFENIARYHPSRQKYLFIIKQLDQKILNTNFIISKDHYGELSSTVMDMFIKGYFSYLGQDHLSEEDFKIIFSAFLKAKASVNYQKISYSINQYPHQRHLIEWIVEQDARAKNILT